MLDFFNICIKIVNMKRLKIYVNEPSEDKKIKVTIPLFIVSACTSLAAWGIKYQSNVEIKNPQLFKKSIKAIIKELKNCEDFDLVDINSNDGQIVKVRYKR